MSFNASHTKTGKCILNLKKYTDYAKIDEENAIRFQKEVNSKISKEKELKE